jgi:putative acetyltransferase
VSAPRRSQGAAADYVLRLYRASDEDGAIALWRDTWQLAYPDIDFAARLPWWRERWRRELVPNAAIVVAEHQGRLAGFVTIDAAGYLDQIVVAQADQGSPLAGLLLGAARQRSPAGITLKVNADNARAIRFYEKAGFVHDGDEVNESSGRAVSRMIWRP